ncbi:Mitochondrial nuclease [Vanrija pseudolonga]|uniref:Endonuclease n=1 Tax=Vanrija pseudolonga TaxID=143232 RepID=A0AAF0YCB6_9TREE|nr:Mitochondrial nuclease [Vanrija pseudolonga]
MPTLGPSLLFAAGLTLGIGAGIFIPRKPAPTPPATAPFVAAPEHAGEKSKAVTLATPSGPVVLAGGFPGPTFDIIKRQAYTAAYDRAKKHPAWTAEHLTAQSLSRTPPTGTQPVPLDTARAADTQPAKTKGDRSKSQFQEDASIPELFRAKLSDYFRSGYDRGHMVPAADAKISQQAMDETFFLSNIAPQVGEGFNRHYWAYLEDFCRRLTSNFEDVYVFTIPLYLPERQADGKWRVSYEVIGQPPAIGVPTHFAKVILASRPDFAYPQKPSSTDKGVTAPNSVKELAMGAFILPNKEIPDEADLRSFIAPVEVVERAAGLQLFNEEMKYKSRQLCAVTQCQVIVRRFDDARKSIGNGKGGK